LGFSRAILSPCGRYLDVHSIGRNHGERYDWESGSLLATRYGEWGPLVTHPEGSLLLVCSVQIETFTQSKLCTWENNSFHWYAPWLLSYIAVGGACFSADGRTLALIGGTGTLSVQIHRFPSCEVLLTLDLDTLPNPEDFDFPAKLCEAVVLSADGRTLFTPTVSGEIVERSLPEGTVHRSWAAHEGMITTFQVHPTHPWLLSGAEDGVIALSEVPALRLAHPLEGDAVTREFQEKFAKLPEGKWTDEAMDVEFEGNIPGAPDE
jgi:WD40 repeat protein